MPIDILMLMIFVASPLWLFLIMTVIEEFWP